MNALWSSLWPVLRSVLLRLGTAPRWIRIRGFRLLRREMSLIPRYIENPQHPRLHRLLFLMVGLAVLMSIALTGCVEIVGPTEGTSYDLRVRVIASETRGGAVYPAEVRTLMTADGPELDYDVTNPDGWTDGLLVPRSAERIWVLVSYQSQDGPFTVGRWITLHRGGTDYVYEVRLDPL